jgi:hypothetical protein
VVALLALSDAAAAVLLAANLVVVCGAVLLRFLFNANMSDAGITEQIRSAADTVAALEDRVSFARALLLQVETAPMPDRPAPAIRSRGVHPPCLSPCNCLLTVIRGHIAISNGMISC